MTMDRKGHYMKPGVKATVPGVLITCVVTPQVLIRRSNAAIAVRSFGSADVTVSYRRRGVWGKMGQYSVDTPDATRELIFNLAIERRLNWVVCPFAAETLTLIRWWEHADSLGVRWRDSKVDRSEDVGVHQSPASIVLTRLVVRGTTDIIEYAERGATFRWVSGYQYFASGPYGSHSDKATDNPDTSGSTQGKGRASRSGSEQAADWSTAFRHLTDWWSRTAKAPFGCTVGQLSVGLLRSSVQPRTLCTHSHPDVHTLERTCAFGGRASTWYVGDVGDGDGSENVHRAEDAAPVRRQIPGPVTHLDVRSMYAYLLSCREYPVKLLHYYETLTVKELLELCAAYGVIARVRLATQTGEYPYRSGERVLYPIGEFTTTLTGPELLRASLDSEIREVFACATYKIGKPFEHFARSVLGERYAARARNDTRTEAFAKHLANALPGKMAQRQGGWERCASEDCPRTWGESYTLNLDTGLTVRTRHIAGVAWRWNEDKTGSGPYTFAFCYLAAYGRLYMRDIRAVCPEFSVVSQDTDGLWVTRTALDALTDAQVPVGEGPGQLSIKGIARNARWYGPRHYYTDGQWILSGFHTGSREVKGSDIVDTFEPSLWASRIDGPPSECRSVRRVSRFKLDIGGQNVLPSGWCRPARLRGR